ncbi:MAG: substrate-binding periplasmic protein [Caldilineaceae bacterium]
MLLLLLLPLLFGRVAGPVALAQNATIVVAVDASFPPFARLNAQGEPEGFDIDLIRALAADAGFAITFEAVQFRYLLSGIAAHLYDIGAGCIFINAERSSYVSFSQPYFATGDTLVVQVDNTTIAQPSDLTADTVVGVLQGSLAEVYGRDQTDALLLPVISLEDALNQLDAGALNAVLADEESLLGYEKMHPTAKLKRVGDLLTYQECSFVLEKNNTELLVKLNTAMTTLKSNGGYERIYRKWFGDRPVHEKPEPTPTAVETAITETVAAATPVVAPIVSSGVATGTVPVSAPSLLSASANVIGHYYLTIPGHAATTAGAASGDSYQLVTVAPNGLWFMSQLVASAAAPSGITITLPAPAQPVGSSEGQPSAPGLWWVNAQQQVEASQLFFSALPVIVGDRAAPAVQRRHYQMSITDDGAVTGFYTTAIYATTALAQSPTATPTITETVEFSGWRIQ